MNFFIGGTTEVFFPLPIPKKMFSVKIKEISNFKFKCLKGQTGVEKKGIRIEKKKREARGAIGFDCDDPLPNEYCIQRSNQVWSTVLNNWELIRKPKPRNSDWKWNDSTASWICELNPITPEYLKKFDRTNFSSCWPTTIK